MAKIKGKWLFNDVIKTHLEWLNEYQLENVIFYSNGERFTGMDWYDIDDDYDTVYHIAYDETLAVAGYYGNICTWENEAYKIIEFDGEQEVSDNFLAWMQENATQQASPTFTYDLTKLNLAAGTYNISVVAKANGYQNAQSETIQFIADQLYVEETNEYGTTMVINRYTEEPNEYGTTMIIGGETTTNLISFTIDGTTYQAKEGMTYAQWVDSEYNTDGFYTNGTFLYDANGATYGTVPNMAVSNVIEQGDSLYMTGGGPG